MCCYEKKVFVDVHEIIAELQLGHLDESDFERAQQGNAKWRILKPFVIQLLSFDVIESEAQQRDDDGQDEKMHEVFQVHVQIQSHNPLPVVTKKDLKKQQNAKGCHKGQRKTLHESNHCLLQQQGLQVLEQIDKTVSKVDKQRERKTRKTAQKLSKQEKKKKGKACKRQRKQERDKQRVVAAGQK
jgi:hypothetical protein